MNDIHLSINTNVFINNQRAATVRSLSIEFNAEEAFATCHIRVLDLLVDGTIKDRKVECFLQRVDTINDDMGIYLQVKDPKDQPVNVTNADMDFFREKFYPEPIEDSPKTFWRFVHNNGV